MYDLADNLLGERSPQNDIDAHLPLAPIADNRLTHWQKLFYRYDAWGNLISRRNGLYEQHYRYDADNRLVQAHGRGPQGEFEAQYHYDALGRRSRKAVRYKGKTEQTIRFLWQGYRLLQEQRDDGSRRSWSYDPASPWSPLAALEQAGDSRSADIYWYHTDLNSAPLEVTDAAGNLCWSGQYDTFGKLQGQTVAGAAKRQGAQYQQPLRYAGQYQDDESGLHYNLFRYYEPEVGRFTTQDPIGLRGGLNLYQYAPNPLMWVDPFGLTAIDASGYHVYGLYNLDVNGMPIGDPYYVGITNDLPRRSAEHLDTGRLGGNTGMIPLDENVKYGQARGYEQYYIEKYKTRTGVIGEEISSTNRGNKYNSFDHGRTDPRAAAFKDAYGNKKRLGGKC